MARVRIVKLPKALSGLEVKMQPGLYGTNGNRQFNRSAHLEAGKISQKPVEVRDTLQPVDREDANLEAEKGETAVLNMGGIPAHFKIGGKRHSQGGTPLNLPDNSFIFSDTAKMKIKDPMILAQFGMKPKRGGYTPAEIAKKYDINKYRKVLADPNSEDLDRKTAEMMIANYNEKLAKLALAQESVKGFPQGIPVIAMPYIDTMKMDPSTFLPDQAEEQSEETEQPDADMGTSRYGSQVISQFRTKRYGGLPFAQEGAQTEEPGFWSKVGHGLLETLEAPQKAMMYVTTGLFGDTEQEMYDPKTKQYKLVSEQNVPMFEKTGWTKTNKKVKAHYEMPGETLKRTYPQSSPVLQGALDVVADPFLISGLAKSGARLAVKKISEEAANQAIKGTLKNAAMYDATRSVLLNAGKKVTGKNIAIAEKAIKAAQKSVDATKTSKAFTTARKAAASELMKQDAAKAAELASQYGLKPIVTAGKGVKYVGKKAADVLKNIDLTGIGPLAAPVASSVARNIGNVALKQDIAQSQAENIKLKEEIERQKENKKGKGSDYQYSGVDKQGRAMFSTPDQPGVYYMFDTSKKQYVLYEPPASTDTTIFIKDIPNIKQEDLDRLRAEKKAGRKIIYKELGGALPKAKLGDEVDPLEAEAQRRKKDIKIKGTKTSGPVTQYDPYPGYTEEELAQLLEDPAILRSSKVAGKQTTGKQGTFGAGVSVEEFMKRNPEYIKKFEAETGEKFDPSKHSEKFQKEYNQHVKDLAYKRAIEAGYNEAEAKEVSERFAKSQGFQEGKLVSGDPRGIDKKFGEYTSSRFEPIFKKVTKPKKEEPKADITTPKKDETPAEKGPIKRYPPTAYGEYPYAPWWLQDIVKTSGAAADLARVKRYLPWQATPEVRLPDATFYDPTRELAANAEQANIQTQGMAAFTGPQALSARSSAIQGQAAKNAADILSRYNNMNVQLANQLSQERTGIMNQAAQNKANLDTALYDKYTIANQQFDNARAMARQNLRQSYIDAITNRAKTQALNTLYPNFYTDPSTGGFVNKTGYAAINPTAPSDEYIEKLWNKAKKLNPNDPASLFKVLYNKKESGEEEEDDGSLGYLRAQRYTG